MVTMVALCTLRCEGILNKASYRYLCGLGTSSSAVPSADVPASHAAGSFSELLPSDNKNWIAFSLEYKLWHEMNSIMPNIQRVSH